MKTSEDDLSKNRFAAQSNQVTVNSGLNNVSVFLHAEIIIGILQVFLKGICRFLTGDMAGRQLVQIEDEIRLVHVENFCLVFRSERFKVYGDII